MKIFRNSAIDGSPPDIVQGFGYVWDSVTASRREIRWPWPSAYQRQIKTEGYRVSDGKVYGHTSFQMESDGQMYVSSLYLSTPDTAEIVVVDVPDGELMTTDRPRFSFGDCIISVVRRNKRYVVCDYSGPTPTYLSADAAAWVDSSVTQQGDTFVMVDSQGRNRLLGFYQSAEFEARIFVSSQLDGTALTVSETSLVDAPVVPVPIDAPSALAAGATSAIWLKQVVPGLADAKVTPFIVIGTAADYGMVVQSLGFGAFTIYLADGSLSLQATTYDWDTEETLVYLFTADSTGALTGTDQLRATLGSSMFVSALTVYPEFDSAPPVVPPFWRGFVKTFETI